MALGVSFLLFLQLPNQMCAKISIKNLSRPSSPRSELSATPVLSWTSFTTNKESVKLDQELQKCVYPTMGEAMQEEERTFSHERKSCRRKKPTYFFFLFQIPTFFARLHVQATYTVKSFCLICIH